MSSGGVTWDEVKEKREERGKEEKEEKEEKAVGFCPASAGLPHCG